MTDDNIPWKNWRLPVGDGHELQIYETGAPNGVPVIFLHGGPGSGFNTKNHNLFDLSKVRLIGFDQRGSGLSTPGGMDGLVHNTTAHLVADIEQLRQHLKIDRPVLYGYSWGTTLAVEYAKRYPQHVTRLLLVSTFVGRQQDQMWSMEGAAAFFPDAYAEMVDGLPTGISVSAYLYQELMSGDLARMQDATYRFDQYGATICSLEEQSLTLTDIKEKDINRARLLLHYAAHDFYLDPALGILADSDKLRDVDIRMLHGRYDMDCLPGAAYEFASHLPQATLKIVMGNHYSSDAVYRPAIRAFIADNLG